MSYLICYSLALFITLYVLFEGRHLLKNREWKQLIVSSLILAASILYSVDYALDLRALPNPNRLIYLLQPVSERLEEYLNVK